MTFVLADHDDVGYDGSAYDVTADEAVAADASHDASTVCACGTA